MSTASTESPLPRQRALLLGKIFSWVALALVGTGLWMTGTFLSPLFNLSLVPLAASARWLNRGTALAQAAVICVTYFLAVVLLHEQMPWNAAEIGRHAAMLLPTLAIGLATSSLSADVTQARARLSALDTSDALTGMLNLHSFSARHRYQHSTAERDKSVYALLHIDIDKLKAINETYGLELGNEVLLLVSRCLQRSIRTSDSAARLSGDEFAILLPGADPAVAEVVINRIRHNVYNTTLDARSRMIRVNVSIGVANYPKDGRSAVEVANLAERRMQRDKELRRAPNQA